MGGWVQASEGREGRDKTQAHGEHEKEQLDYTEGQFGEFIHRNLVREKTMFFDIFSTLATWLGLKRE